MTNAARARARSGIARWVPVLAALCLGAGHAGCDEGEPSDVQSYTDDAGRSCTVDLADISLTATCDADPSALVMCAAGREAAFVLHDDFDFDTMISTRLSCPACIDRAARETLVADPCANVECTSDADCLNRDGDVRPFTCTGGVCLRS